MQLHKQIWVSLGLMLILIYCHDPAEHLQSDYVIFGTSYGECLGDCAYLFLVQDRQAFPDQM